MTTKLGKRQRENLEAYLSRRLIPRDQPLLRACAAYVMPCNPETAIEPSLREMVFLGLAGAESVFRAYRIFEDSPLSEIGADLLVEQDMALGRLLEALTTGQMMTAVSAASDLRELGGRAEGLILLSGCANNAARDAQARSAGGLSHAREQRGKIGRREDILEDLFTRAMAAVGEKHAGNVSYLARWMLGNWPKIGPSPQELKAGDRTVRDWVKLKIRPKED